jgi:hypothetical protein
MGRPYITPYEFYEKQDLCFQALESLEEKIAQHIRFKRGMISIQEMDKKIFPIIIHELDLSERDQYIIEGLFDAYCGLTTMVGMEGAFKTLRLQIEGKFL